MTEEFLENANNLRNNYQYYKIILKKLENIPKNVDIYHKPLLKITGLKLDVEIPDELLKTILDLLCAHYTLLASKTEKDFEELKVE